MKKESEGSTKIGERGVGWGRGWRELSQSTILSLNTGAKPITPALTQLARAPAMRPLTCARACFWGC